MLYFIISLVMIQNSFFVINRKILDDMRYTHIRTFCVCCARECVCICMEKASMLLF